ncbi:MAG: AAA family ATPase [Candidatus Dependentiae bacterium]|nr:AAA family ATPase [Candidatus Dependentiae bacterium]
MNNSVMKKTFLFLTLLLSQPLSHAFDDTTNIGDMNEISATIIEQAQNILEDQLKKILTQFNAVDCILGDLALVVNNDQVPQTKNKKTVIQGIISVRSLIESVQKDAFVNVSLRQNLMILKILEGLIAHTKQALSDGLTEFPAFDFVTYFQSIKSPQDDSTIDIDALQKNIDAQIADLNSQAASVGLAWYNRAYRKLNDYLIQPSIKAASIGNAGKIAIATSLAAWYFLWYRTEKGEDPNASSKFSHWLRSKVGEHVKIQDRGAIINDDKLGWIGRFEKEAFNLTHGHAEIGKYLVATASPFYYEAFKNASSWCGKKIERTHNFLLGGAYKNKKIEDALNASIEPKYTFDDLVGLDYVKEALSLVVKYVEDPERWDRSKLTPEKGYLLTGPTRSGKSFSAEALAGEIKKVVKRQGRNPDEIGFYVIKGSYIESMGIAKILEMAKREAPCVLFIDEIDLLRLQRAGGNTSLLNEFLTSMSGCLDSDPKKQVIILAATNRPENMDEALKQPGRFGKEIRFDYPGFEHRKEYFIKRLYPVCPSLDRFDLDKVCLETAGCSFETMNSVLKKAIQKSKIQNLPLTQEALDDALDTEVRNMIPGEFKQLSQEEKNIIATHQAGHALATILLDSAEKLTKVTIRPIQEKLKEESPWEAYYKQSNSVEHAQAVVHGKMFTQCCHHTLNLYTKNQKMNLCKIKLAGHIAEELLLGSSGYSYHMEDKEHALRIAQSIVFQGLIISNLPEHVQDKMIDASLALLSKCESEVKELLANNKVALQAISIALQKHLTLTAQDVQEIMDATTSATNTPELTEPVAA